MTLEPHIEKVGQEIIGSAIKVHRLLGPGLLEGVYQPCLVHELKKRALTVAEQVNVPIVFEDLKIENGLRLDILVNDLIIIEVKAVEQILPVHQAQLLSYLRLTEKHLGFLLNFNVPLMKDGIKRLIR